MLTPYIRALDSVPVELILKCLKKIFEISHKERKKMTWFQITTIIFILDLFFLELLLKILKDLKVDIVCYRKKGCLHITV